VFFGGFGEPLAHRDIVTMVTQAKALGARVELITNGTLLDEALARQLIAAQLDVLWVSLDGPTPESFADVRLGAALPQILENVMRFRELRSGGYYPVPEIGIAFVAMKRNIAQLPDLLALSRWLGAAHVKVTNVLPYTADLRDEILYWRVLMDGDCPPSPGVPHVMLPKINVNDVTRRPLYYLLNSHRTITYADYNLQSLHDRCPFIESGVMAIAWDGGVSPCLPLMHDHVSYVDRYERHSRRYTVGNVNDSDLIDLWQQTGYLAFRRRVREFEFAPCTSCGGCQLLEANEEDCIGNTFPTCGGCLWAQGVIQCP
jgi:MoaA/NifB/PqqE/SkfB family radical SAM enzyme